MTLSPFVTLSPFESRKAVPIGNARLQRRLQQIEKLAAKDKRQVLQVLDAFIERAQLRQRSG